MNFYENMNLFRKAKNESEHKNKNLKEEGISESILEIKNAIEETRRYTQDDDSHIIMQLRSAQDLNGNKDVAFRGGKKAKVDIKDINTVLKAHDSIPKPENKRRFRIMISKSHEDLKNIAKELREEADLNEELFICY